MTESTNDFSPHKDSLMDIRTPKDLLQKLEYEYLRLVTRGVPHPYDVINFILTANALVDWNQKYTGKYLNLLEHHELNICRHIANGAKHFHIDRERGANAVKSIKVDRYVEAGYYIELPEDPPIFNNTISITTIDKNSKQEIKTDFLDLAEKIMKFWKNEIS